MEPLLGWQGLVLGRSQRGQGRRKQREEEKGSHSQTKKTALSGAVLQSQKPER